MLFQELAIRIRNAMETRGAVLPDGLSSTSNPTMSITAPPDRADSAGLEILTISSLLEGEAMIATERAFRGVRLSDFQREVMADHPYVWDIAVARGHYASAFHQVRKILPVDEAARNVAVDLFLLITDISLAYPSLSLRSEGADGPEFFPTCKFMFLCRALQSLRNTDEFPRFLDAMYQDPIDTERAEAILCKGTKYENYGRRRIYENWLAELKTLKCLEMQPIIDLRIRAINAYLLNFKSHINLRTEGLRGAAGTPWMCLTPMGLAWHFYPLADGESENYRLTTEQFSSVLSYNRDREALLAFAGLRPFVCPVAETRLCPVQIASCEAHKFPEGGGITTVNDSRCSFTSTLLRQSWNQTFRLPPPTPLDAGGVPIGRSVFAFDHMPGWTQAVQGQ
jgi:hypothetical protein